MNEELLVVVERILSYERKKLIRDFGEFQFTDVADQIDSLRKLAEDLKESPDLFNKLPHNQRSALSSELGQLEETLEAINSFDPTQMPDPNGRRSELSGQISSRYEALFPYINIIDIESMRRAGSQATLTNLVEEAKSALKEAQKTKKDLDKLVSSTKVVSGKVTAQNYLGIFSQQSKTNMFMAIAGGMVAIGLGVVLVMSALKIADTVAIAILASKSAQQVVSLILVKFFFVAIALFSMQIAFRFTFANLHLMTVNKHKENILKVFNALIDIHRGTDLEKMLIVSLTSSIVDLSETGFLPGKDLAKDGPDVTNIVKDAAQFKG